VCTIFHSSKLFLDFRVELLRPLAQRTFFLSM
jgi:hypothetical protein